MVKYKNLSKNSGVLAYETSEGSITVKFVGDKIYLYTVESCGSSAIAEMQKLAKEGRGLSIYISTTVRKKYVAKLS